MSAIATTESLTNTSRCLTQLQAKLRTGGGGGIRTYFSSSDCCLHKPNTTTTDTMQTDAEYDICIDMGSSQKYRSTTLPKQRTDVFEQKKCALCVHCNETVPDLTFAVQSWDELPRAIRSEILNAIREECSSKWKAASTRRNSITEDTESQVAAVLRYHQRLDVLLSSNMFSEGQAGIPWLSTLTPWRKKMTTRKLPHRDAINVFRSEDGDICIKQETMQGDVEIYLSDIDVPEVVRFLWEVVKEKENNSPSEDSQE
jgi:hypothetical protein